MTSMQPSGFPGKDTNGFDPMNQKGNIALQATGPAPPLQQRGDNSPEEQCTEMEHKVNRLIEESAVLAKTGETMGALEKAKEAGKMERQLNKQREQLGLGDQINADLTYAVMFNVAIQFHKAELYTEALNTFSLLVRNKQYAQSGRLRVNMGNIYLEMKKYPLAIKMYRLALDEIPQTGQDLKFKIIRNIGNAYVKLGQYKDAIEAFEQVMGGSPDIVTAFNLLLCYFALGEPEKLKSCFKRMLNIRVAGSTVGDDDDDDEETTLPVNRKKKEASDVLVADTLKEEVRARRRQWNELVTAGARLIAPVLDPRDWRIGFDWVIEDLKNYEIKEPSSRLASELEMCKALNYLKYKKYRDAMDGLKAFEKKDKVLRAKAATNLSYLYFLEGDFDSGEKYADMSVEADRYKAKALVNKGNFLYVRGEFEKAKQYFTDAIVAETDCVEALYNLGLTNKQLHQYEDAVRTFKRLSNFIDSTEVIYHIADIYDRQGESSQAAEWFNRVISKVPTDPNVLARLGLLRAKDGEESGAFQYYLEAYRYYQVNMDVISWLGAYFVKNEVYDKAMQFFERASQIQPHEVKWQLMVASCHRRRGEYPQAKRLYESIHRRYPENMECLRYLFHLCQDAGMTEEANQWSMKMRKLEGHPAPHLAGNSGVIGIDGEELDNPSDTVGAVSVEADDGKIRRRGSTLQKKPVDDDDEMILPGT